MFEVLSPLLESIGKLDEFGQRFHNVHETGNKLPVISAQGQEDSNFMFVLHGRPLPNGSQLLGIGISSGNTI